MAKKAKVLLIDKDSEFIEATQSALEKAGHQVITATSSREGMDKVQFELPDIIVMELMLEKHDSGFTFTRKIKANPLYKKIKVFLVSSAKEKTGFDFSQELDGYWMKTDDFANKPITPEELVNRIQNLIKNEAN